MRILVTEDDKALSMVMCELFNQEGYITDTAFDGEEGYDCAVSGIYDIIILDIMLPVTDGLTVLRRLRKEGVKTPVLLLSAKSQIEDKVKGLDSGADDYLTKPFNTVELLARIRALLRRRDKEYTELAFEFMDIMFDKERHEIKKDNRTIKLTKKEFSILDVLTENVGKVVTKETIILKIWGYDTEIEYNSSEVYVSFLRKKLKAIGSRIKISNVRGVGYILEEQE